MNNGNLAVLKPAPGRILVEPIENKEDVISVSTGQEDIGITKGKVIAIGVKPFSKEEWVDAPCEIGDIILWSEVGYNTIEIDYKKYVVVPFENVLGVLNAK